MSFIPDTIPLVGRVLLDAVPVAYVVVPFTCPGLKSLPYLPLPSVLTFSLVITVPPRFIVFLPSNGSRGPSSLS